MKETTRKETGGRVKQDVYLCPECGEPFDNVTTTESHVNDVYEIHVKGSHGKPHE